MVIIRKKHKETPEEKELRQQQEEAKARGIQDQYQARGFELLSWVQNHKGTVFALIGVLILAGALLSGYLFYQKRSQEGASTAYLAAAKLVEADQGHTEADVEKRKKALIEFQDLGKRVGTTGVGELAHLYAAHLALDEGEAKNAVMLYKEALAGISKSDILYPLAMTGYGYAQEASGDEKAALSTFLALSDLKNNPSKDLALYESGRLAIKLKETDQAKKSLARLLEEYPASPYESSAQKFRDSLE